MELNPIPVAQPFWRLHYCNPFVIVAKFLEKFIQRRSFIVNFILVAGMQIMTPRTLAKMYAFWLNPIPSSFFQRINPGEADSFFCFDQLRGTGFTWKGFSNKRDLPVILEYALC